MIIGVVPVSQLIDRTGWEKIAVVGNKTRYLPRGNSGSKTNKTQNLDTPGILWPKFEDETVSFETSPNRGN